MDSLAHAPPIPPRTIVINIADIPPLVPLRSDELEALRKRNCRNVRQDIVNQVQYIIEQIKLVTDQYGINLSLPSIIFLSIYLPNYITLHSKMRADLTMTLEFIGKQGFYLGFPLLSEYVLI